MVGRSRQGTLWQALIFIDTSAWYALKATDDRFDDEAVSSTTFWRLADMDPLSYPIMSLTKLHRY